VPALVPVNAESARPRGREGLAGHLLVAGCWHIGYYCIYRLVGMNAIHMIKRVYADKRNQKLAKDSLIVVICGVVAPLALEIANEILISHNKYFDIITARI